MASCYRCGVAIPEGKRVCSACRAPYRKKKLKADIRNAPLTFRENQLVALVAKGFPNKRVAFELGLTEGTVKEYLNRIYIKAQVGNRTQLAVWFLSNR